MAGKESSWLRWKSIRMMLLFPRARTEQEMKKQEGINPSRRVSVKYCASLEEIPLLSSDEDRKIER